MIVGVKQDTWGKNNDILDKLFTWRLLLVHIINEF